MQRQDITNCLSFTRGEAKFTRIDRNAKTGVEAWRRYYPSEPWRDCIEIITREGGMYYPQEERIMRRFPDNAEKWQRIDFYLQNGIGVWYPGDKPEGITGNDE